MKLISLVLLAPLVGGLTAPGLAQERSDAERSGPARTVKKQDTRRASGAGEAQDRVQNARDAKRRDNQDRAQDAARRQNQDRADKAQEKKQQTDAERAEAKRKRDARRAEAARDAQDTENEESSGISGQRINRGATDQERIQKAREADQRTRGASDAERAANARNAQQRTAAAREAAARKNQIVSDVTRRVRDHRVRFAELARLEQIFADQGERDKVARVQALRDRERTNFANAMKRYKTELGNEDFNRLKKRLRLEDGNR